MEHKQDDDRASLRYSFLGSPHRRIVNQLSTISAHWKSKAVSTLLYLNVNTIVTGVEGKAEPLPQHWVFSKPWRITQCSIYSSQFNFYNVLLKEHLSRTEGRGDMFPSYSICTL